MPNRLKNLDVQWISLVKTPANGLPLLLKDANLKPFRVLKTDEARQMVYGVVYAPNMVDSQGDFADRFEIERAAHGFLKAGRGQQVDANHGFEPLPGAYVAESWITRGDDGFFSDGLQDAWAVGIKVEDETLWTAIKAGEWSGLSLAGQAEREPVGDSPLPDATSPPTPDPSPSPGEVTVSKAEFDALVKAVEAIAASLAEPAPPTSPPTPDPSPSPSMERGQGGEVVPTPDPSPSPSLEKGQGGEGMPSLLTRLDEIQQSQTALADRLTAVEKQRLSVAFAPPAPPKNWLCEVL